MVTNKAMKRLARQHFASPLAGRHRKRLLSYAYHTAFALLLLPSSGCAEPPSTSLEDSIDIQRVESSVKVRRAQKDVELLRIDVAAAETVRLQATTADLQLLIEAAPTPPGVAISASLNAYSEDGTDIIQTLEIRNDLVVEDDVVYRLYDWQERNHIVEALNAGPVGRALYELAPYAEAIDAHMTEGRPALTVIGLFQSWPEGIEPAWPLLDDPRDSAPPGHRPDDIIGVGMTCSTSIRCPSFAPYCVTVDHEVTFGFCTRACVNDDDCASETGIGRCTMPVTDIPGVTGSVLACRVECELDSCPGLLECQEDTSTCEAVNDP